MVDFDEQPRNQELPGKVWLVNMGLVNYSLVMVNVNLIFILIYFKVYQFKYHNNSG